MASLDVVFDLLQPEHRRYALYYLDDHDTPVAVDEVAQAVATMTADADTAPGEQRTEYEIELQHTHLPHAAEAEFVEYDADEGVVRLTDEPPEFEALLTVAKAIERPQ